MPAAHPRTGADLNIVFFGTGAYGLPALESLAESRHKILSVVTSPDRARGRFLKSEESPIKSAARRLGLPVFEYDKSRADEALVRVRKLAPDFLVVVSFGFLLPGEMLEVPRIAPLNIHPSLLPRHRGASPMPWSILEGDSETGVTIIRMNERLDAGDIAAQTKTALGPDEDLPALEKRLSAAGARLLVQTLDAWEKNKVVLRPQDESRATYTRKFSKADAALDFSLPAAVLSRRVRAFKGWPGTCASVRGKRLLVHRAAAVPAAQPAEPGTVLRAGAEGIDVAAGEGALSLLSVQLEGKKEMPAGDFLRGFPIQTGEKFDKID